MSYTTPHYYPKYEIKKFWTSPEGGAKNFRFDQFFSMFLKHTFFMFCGYFGHFSFLGPRGGEKFQTRFLRGQIVCSEKNKVIRKSYGDFRTLPPPQPINNEASLREASLFIYQGGGRFGGGRGKISSRLRGGRKKSRWCLGGQKKFIFFIWWIGW